MHMHFNVTSGQGWCMGGNPAEGPLQPQRCSNPNVAMGCDLLPIKILACPCI